MATDGMGQHGDAWCLKYYLHNLQAAPLASNALTTLTVTTSQAARTPPGSFRLWPAPPT